MSSCRIRIACGICWLIGVIAPAWGAAPSIKKLDPAEGRAGQKIKVIGDDLKRTRSVDFLVGKTFRAAKFRPLSNTELEITVPEFHRPGAQALILLQSPDGVTVTWPATETVVRENDPQPKQQSPASPAQVVHVLRGGVVKNAGVTTLIAAGGVVSRADRAPLVLVKNGGTLVEGDGNHPAIVVYEPAARFGRDVFAPGQQKLVLPVREIGVAEGVGPFVYRPAPVKAELKVATAPPEVTLVHPLIVLPGDMVTLTGKGFAGTEEVYLASGSMHAAGFKIVSDTELEVDTPDDFTGRSCELIVINAKGLTVTMSPPPQPVFPAARPRREDMPHFLHVADGTVLTGKETNQLVNRAIFLIDSGGTISGGSHQAVVLVKSGGTALDAGGPVFFEPGATVPRSGGKSQMAPLIQVSPLRAGLEFILPATSKK
jgi:hypothetical protein